MEGVQSGVIVSVPPCIQATNVSACIQVPCLSACQVPIWLIFVLHCRVFQLVLQCQVLFQHWCFGYLPQRRLGGFSLVFGFAEEERGNTLSFSFVFFCFLHCFQGGLLIVGWGQLPHLSFCFVWLWWDYEHVREILITLSTIFPMLPRSSFVLQYRNSKLQYLISNKVQKQENNDIIQ